VHLVEELSSGMGMMNRVKQKYTSIEGNWTFNTQWFRGRLCVQWNLYSFEELSKRHTNCNIKYIPILFTDCT